MAKTNHLASEALIRDLCRLEFGDKYSEDQYDYVLQILSLNFECSPQISDPSSILEKMKQDLSSQQEFCKSTRIMEIYNKLISRNSFKNFQSILHLLRKLSKYKSPETDFTLSFQNPYAPSFRSIPASKGFDSGDKINSTVIQNDKTNTLLLGSRLAWGLSDTNLLSSTKQSQSSVGSKTITENQESSSFALNENTALNELLHVIQGVDTIHVKVSDKHLKEVFVKDNTTNSPYVYSLVKKLGELGWLHNRIKGYIDKHSGQQTFGLVGQAFCSALRQELSEYYVLLSVLQSQIKMAEHGIIIDEKGLSIAQLYVMLNEPRNKLKWIVTIIDNCKENKGGALASILYSFMQTGNKEMRTVTKRLLVICSQPIFYILNNWIYNGELRDVYNEFFVAIDPNVSTELLWFDKYYLRQPATTVPSFITQKQARKILLIGKSINFLRIVCHDSSPIPMNENDTKLMTNEKFVNNSIDFKKLLEDCINSAYNSVCQYLLQVLHEKFKLLTHLQALRKFLLLGQGDFVRHLLDLLHDDLALPASLVYRHNLTGLVEEAVRATNAQYEDPDVLARLSLRILEINPGETGWDVFTLVYFVDPPLSTIITPDIMHFYLRIFNFLWRAKRMEHNLATMWTKTMEKSRLLYDDIKEMRCVLHTCNILASEMVHFVHQMQYYIAFEVLECSWADLLKKVETSQDLDEIIAAHQSFLETVMKRCLLDENSKNLFAQLRSIYDQIVKFDGTQESLFQSGMFERESRQRYDNKILEQEAKGVWGVDKQKVEEEKSRQRKFRKEELPKMRVKLNICRQSFQDMVVNFLKELTSNDDSNLRHLSWRLNFNNNYKL